MPAFHRDAEHLSVSDRTANKVILWFHVALTFLSRWEQRKVSVIPPFDIFRTVDGQWLWLESAPTLDTAKERVNALMAALPTEYMVSSHVTGKRISLKPGDSDWSEVFRPKTA
jgi:hypothetical protein